MKESKQKRLLGNQTHVCRKVFAVVPIKESWTKIQIHSELLRTTGKNDVRLTEGCLNSLVGSKLVTENPRGTFRRVAITGTMNPDDLADIGLQELTNTPKTTDFEREPPVTEVKDDTPTLDAMERLGDLATQASQIGGIMQRFAIDLEETMLAVDAEIGEQSEKLKQLAQLKTLLNGLT
jgi:hypothetical protein